MTVSASRLRAVAPPAQPCLRRECRVPIVRARVAAALALLSVLWFPAWAEETKPAPDSVAAEEKAAFKAAGAALQAGPRDIVLAGQVTLALPEGYAYVPPAEGARLMRAMGNSAGDSFQGLIVPRSRDDTFSFYELTYEAAGYIKDDDARDWKADELLQQLRDGTAEGNKRRAAMGVGELEVTGWIEQPRYDAGRHQLVWSIGSRAKGAPPGESEGVNYRTLMLGREGYLAMTLVTDRAHLDGLRMGTDALLGKLSFNSGKRYADFNSSTDHVAEFGLAALIAGVAAKKLGLLALAVAFVVKFAKVIVLAVGGFIWAARRKLGLARKAPAAATPAAPAVLAADAPATAAQPPAAAPPGPGQG
jgi:uncharacterized membrane-anchored protein